MPRRRSNRSKSSSRRRRSSSHSKSSRRSGSIVPVRKGRKVTGFQKYVPHVTKQGKTVTLPRFLPESKWPRDRSTLRRLGVTETFEQIRENNRALLARGRAARKGRGGRGSRKSRSSRGRSRSSSKSARRRSASRRARAMPRKRSGQFLSPKSAAGKRALSARRRSRSKRSSRGKSRRGRKSSKSSKVGRLSEHEKRFREHYTRGKPAVVGTTKKLRESMMYSAPVEKKEQLSIGASVSRGRSSRSSSKSARRRRARAMPRRKSGQFLSPKSAAGKRALAARRRSRSQRKSRSSRKSRTQKKSRRSQRRSQRKGSRKSQRKSVRRDSRSWSKKKNLALRRLMKKEFGHILTKAEYQALPKGVQRELQLQAYESAYPAKVKSSPDRLLSNKRLSQRLKERSRKEASAEKARAKRETSAAKRGRAQYRRAPKDAEGDYPGEEQAIKDFIDAYAKMPYKTQAARVAAMTKDLKSSKNVVKRSTSYKAWKANPKKYDLGGIDTAGASGEFMQALRKPRRK